MKTLRKYVVNGSLYVGDGKTPAAVGDQVRLFLDTEAHPDFPEYIVGTIQHPVASMHGGTSVSYSFEYNEADLLGIVANLIIADVISVTVVSVFEVITDALNEHIGAGGTAHVNVVAAGAAGFMTGADKTKLDGVAGTNTGDETAASIVSKLGGSAGKIGAGVLPNALTGTGNPNRTTFASDFAGLNNDVVITGVISTVEIVAVASPNPTSSAFIYDSTTKTIYVNIGSPGGNAAGTMTASQLIALTIQGSPPVPGEGALVRTLAAGNNGSGNIVPGGYAAVSNNIGSYISQEYHDSTNPNEIIVWFWSGFDWKLSIPVILVDKIVDLGSGVSEALQKPTGTTGSVQIYGEPMSPSALIVPDMTGITAPAGSVGRRLGGLVMADGVTVGGNFIEGRTIKGFHQHTGTQLFNKIQKFKIFDSETLEQFSNLKLFGQVTIRPQGLNTNLPSVTEIGIGFAFNANSNLSKDHASNPWFYAELHPTPGTAKNLTYVKANIACNSAFGTDGLPETHWGIPSFCKEYAEWATGNDAIKTGTLSLFANPSFDLSIPTNQDADLWLMVHSKNASAAVVHYIVYYDLTLQIDL
jgi:hypothetical protein